MDWNVVEIRQDRYKLYKEQEAMHLRAAEEKRAFTAEEQAEWERREADLERLTAEIERHEKLETRMQQAQALAAIRPVPEGAADDDAYSKAFRCWLQRGAEGLTAEERGLLQSKETRALGVTTGAAGGFLVPQGFYQRIWQAMRDYGGVRDSRAYILPTESGNPLPAPTLDDTANAGMRIAENTQITDLALTYGQRVLGAHLYTSRIIRVSVQLMEDSAFNLETHLAEVMGTRIGRITNSEFTVGTGTDMPQGVVTAASSGVVAAAGSATSITYPNLVAMEHALDPAYRRGAQWMFHDTTLRALKQMVDSQGRPLWLPGLATREADTLLGYRYVVNQDMVPMAASARSILFGDFSRFVVRDVQNMQVMRLVERYADFLQVGFLAYSRHDSALMDPAAVRFYQNSAT